jgi:hypothetical protein
VTATEPSTLSLAEAPDNNVAASGVAPLALVASIVVSVSVSTGPVVSDTVTVALLDPALPVPSLAENVTVVAPKGNVSGASVVTVTAPLTVSVATAAVKKVVIVVSVAGVPVASTAATVMFSGATTIGLVVSDTVTVAVAVTVLLLLSVVVNVTVVSPRGKVEEASVVIAELISPSRLSEAVPPVKKATISVLDAGVPSDPSASTLIELGAEIVGSTVSPAKVTVMLDGSALTSYPAAAENFE